MTELNIQTNFHSQVWNHVKQAVSTGSITKVKGGFARSFDDIWNDIKHEVRKLVENTRETQSCTKNSTIIRRRAMI